MYQTDLWLNMLKTVMCLYSMEKASYADLKNMLIHKDKENNEKIKKLKCCKRDI